MQFKFNITYSNTPTKTNVTNDAENDYVKSFLTYIKFIIDEK